MVAQIESTQANTKTVKMNLPVAPSKGIVQVFTAAQRSFYTDVMAQALRVAVQGTTVLAVQFFQGGIRQGVEYPRRLGKNLDWLRCDLSRNIDRHDCQLTAEESQAVLDLWQYVKRAIAAGDYGLFVLDELNLAIQFELISEAEVADTLQQRPSQIDIILTGAEMPDGLIDCADRVTQHRMI